MKYYIALILTLDLIHLGRVLRSSPQWRKKLLFMAIYHVAAYLPIYGRAQGLY